MKKYTLLATLLMVSSSVANEKDRVVFSFDKPEDARPWRTVNDGVMGGRSVGRFRVNDDKNMEFYGYLSLANNGGFASVRARGSKLGLEQGDSIVARVRGDGRKYNFNLYTRSNLGGYSYRQSFQTKKGEWMEIRLPADQFVATWRGRRFPEGKTGAEQSRWTGHPAGR